jgi:hypothetical protein
VRGGVGPLARYVYVLKLAGRQLARLVRSDDLERENRRRPQARLRAVEFFADR